MLALVQNICDNRIPDLKPPIKRKLGNFIKVIQKLKRFASEVGPYKSYDLVCTDHFI